MKNVFTVLILAGVLLVFITPSSILSQEVCDKIPEIPNGYCRPGVETNKVGLPSTSTTTEASITSTTTEEDSGETTEEPEPDEEGDEEQDDEEEEAEADDIEELAKLATTGRPNGKQNGIDLRSDQPARKLVTIIILSFTSKPTSTRVAVTADSARTVGTLNLTTKRPPASSVSYPQLECSCRDHYRLINGSSTIRCIGSNKWTAFPTCQAVAEEVTQGCSTLPTIPGASCRQTRAQLDEQTLLASNSSNSNKWIDMGTPRVFQNLAGESVVQIFYKPNTQFDCRCNPGYYQQSSSSYIICMANGEWSDLPICTPAVTTMSPVNHCVPREVENADGFLVGENDVTGELPLERDGTMGLQNIFLTPGRRIRYRCKSGYQLTGTAYVTCSPRGTWSGFPTCSANGCTGTAKISGGRCVKATNFGDPNTYQAGEQAKCSCDSDKIMSSGIPVITCQLGGRWSALPRCAPRPTTAPRPTCPTPPKIEGAGCNCDGTTQATPIFHSGDTVRYTCNNGYQMVGDPIITCQQSGEWTEAPACNALSRVQQRLMVTGCPKPRRVPNASCPCYGETPTRYEHGVQVRFTCNQGYKMHGSPTVRCQENGSWSTYPTCQQVSAR